MHGKINLHTHFKSVDKKIFLFWKPTFFIKSMLSFKSLDDNQMTVKLIYVWK